MWGLALAVLIFSDCGDIAKDTTAAYDQMAARYQVSHDHISPNVSRLREIFLQLVGRGGRGLDIGSGPGRDSLHFQNQGVQMTAIDASPEMVRLAEATLGDRGQALVMRAQEMFFEESYDGVWAMASLIHIPDAQLKDVFVRIFRGLKPGGVFVGSFIKGIGTPDVGEVIPDGRYFNRVSERRLREIVAQIPRFEVIEEFTYVNDDDFHGSNKPSPDFGFFNLALRKKVE